MYHNEILEIFKKLFPMFAFGMTEWFPNGKNSIRVRLDDIGDFVFTCENEATWSFETFANFMNKIRVE